MEELSFSDDSLSYAITTKYSLLPGTGFSFSLHEPGRTLFPCAFRALSHVSLFPVCLSHGNERNVALCASRQRGSSRLVTEAEATVLTSILYHKYSCSRLQQPRGLYSQSFNLNGKPLILHSAWNDW